MKTKKEKPLTSDSMKAASEESDPAIRRKTELRGFGVLQNPLYTWFNPIFFAYHMGGPGYPESMSPKKMLTTPITRRRS